MPVLSNPTGGRLTATIVRYTATGSEGIDFAVPITGFNADDYEVTLSPQLVAAYPGHDFPNEVAGDRTTTQFRMRVAGALTAGDKLVFLLFH